MTTRRARTAQRALDRSLLGGTGYSDEQVMLTLALLSYRGFHDARPGPISRARLRASIASGLEELAPLGGVWELMWGPATYRSPISIFDAAAVFVVRHRSVPSRYAVVVRGTNPVSAFDWLFGDFWSGATVAWPYGHTEVAGDPRLSLSSAFGLSVVQAMRSPRIGAGIIDGVIDALETEVVSATRSALGRMMRPLGRAAARTMSHVRSELKHDVRAVERAHRRLRRLPMTNRVEGMIRFREDIAPVQRRVVKRLETLGEIAGPDAQVDLLKAMEGSVGLRSRLVAGPTLTAFLRRAAAASDDALEVIVAGHSKGGALATVMAMWLADTTGTEGLGLHEQWDPSSRARIRCYSFAGPTPGNRDFAARVDQRLGTDHVRISNRLDIVPHAWATRAGADASGFYIDDIPDIYGSGVDHVDALDTLAKTVVADVADLDYGHTARSVHVLHTPVAGEKTMFLEQVAYQHADGYVEGLGLGDVIGSVDFFDPLR